MFFVIFISDFNCDLPSGLFHCNVGIPLCQFFKNQLEKQKIFKATSGLLLKVSFNKIVKLLTVTNNKIRLVHTSLGVWGSPYTKRSRTLDYWNRPPSLVTRPLTSRCSKEVDDRPDKDLDRL